MNQQKSIKQAKPNYQRQKINPQLSVPKSNQTQNMPLTSDLPTINLPNLNKLLLPQINSSSCSNLKKEGIQMLININSKSPNNYSKLSQLKLINFNNSSSKILSNNLYNRTQQNKKINNKKIIAYLHCKMIGDSTDRRLSSTIIFKATDMIMV